MLTEHPSRPPRRPRSCMGVQTLWSPRPLPMGLQLSSDRPLTTGTYHCSTPRGRSTRPLMSVPRMRTPLRRTATPRTSMTGHLAGGANRVAHRRLRRRHRWQAAGRPLPRVTPDTLFPLATALLASR